ncbi:MAG: GTPase Era [Anaerolineae bacterium]|nr:GTPase Era [Anaerolineae bacterium]
MSDPSFQKENLPAHRAEPAHRAGFVSVIGRPNVGKSTLMNAYLGQKISIVSSKPQTTRRRVMGILTLEQAQIIFVDTPGIHKPMHRLGEVMVETALQAIPDADVLLWLVDASHAPTDEDRHIAQLLQAQAQDIPVILGLNKCDLVPEPEREARASTFTSLLPASNAIFVSATAGENRDRLLALLIDCLPENPPFYPDDQVTDQTERAIAAELIREQVLLRARQEVPHAVDVIVDEFTVRSARLTYIHATIIVERDSQKGILLGHDGKMIKAISQAARQQIEEMVEARVYLELWVKVRPKWRQKDNELKRLGYMPTLR